jgi:hypothetical protein
MKWKRRSIEITTYQKRLLERIFNRAENLSEKENG